MEASKEATLSIGEKEGWCTDCRFSAVCLPRGHPEFVNHFEWAITVKNQVFRTQGDLDEMIAALVTRLGVLVCQLGQPGAGGPFGTDVRNAQELAIFIQGFARGMSEVVCELLSSGKCDDKGVTVLLSKKRGP